MPCTRNRLDCAGGRKRVVCGYNTVEEVMPCTRKTAQLSGRTQTGRLRVRDSRGGDAVYPRNRLDCAGGRKRVVCGYNTVEEVMPCTCKTAQLRGRTQTGRLRVRDSRGGDAVYPRNWLDCGGGRKRAVCGYDTVPGTLHLSKHSSIQYNDVFLSTPRFAKWPVAGPRQGFRLP